MFFWFELRSVSVAHIASLSNSIQSSPYKRRGCLPQYLPEQLSLGDGVAPVGGELEHHLGVQVPGWEGGQAVEVRDERCWSSLRKELVVEVISPQCFDQTDVPGNARRRSAC
jgi:hypothetical protein